VIPDEPRRRGLTSDDERRLAARIAEGDCDARNALVQANLGLVVRIARAYVDRGLMMEDLVGEGNLGLIRAAQEFDPRFGTRFSTYATYWIKDSILSALMNTTSTIRVPAHMVKLLLKWRRTEQALGCARGRPPRFEEVAKALGLTEEQKDLVAKARQASGLQPGGSLAAESYTRSTARTMVAHQEPEAMLEAIDDRDDLQRRLERLGSRERMILSLRYGLGGEPPLTLQEIGCRLGVTKEWVRQITTQAIRQLVKGSGPDFGAPPRPGRAADRQNPQVRSRFHPRSPRPPASPCPANHPPIRLTGQGLPPRPGARP
jgi:RNA polymerase primary sigma factor